APSRDIPATVTPVPAHASSAMACSVIRAWQIRQARPVASSSSDVAERSHTTAHSSATSPGSSIPSPSTQALQPALASAIAWGQSDISGGGQLLPSGGETANRYASERARTTSVNATRSGAHSSNSSPSRRPAMSCHSAPMVKAPPARPGDLPSPSIATFHHPVQRRGACLSPASQEVESPGPLGRFNQPSSTGQTAAQHGNAREGSSQLRPARRRQNPWERPLGQGSSRSDGPQGRP